MKLRSRLLAFRATRMLRRANRRRLRRLEAELASYTSEADLNDLYASLQAYSDQETHEVRQVLCQQQVRRIWTAGGMR
jgi:hypothetical protein